MDTFFPADSQIVSVHVQVPVEATLFVTLSTCYEEVSVECPLLYEFARSQYCLNVVVMDFYVEA